MKTKKIFTVLSLMIGLMVSTFALTACGGDDNNDSPSNPLVGTWYIESVEKGETYYSEITYNSDYTCTWREYKSDRKTLLDSDAGKYKIEGNTLSIWWNSEQKYWDEDGPWTTTFTISGNKMTTTERGGSTWTKK